MNFIFNAVKLTLLLGVTVCFAAALFSFVVLGSFVFSAKSTQGVVVKVLCENSKESGQDLYRPVFEYIDDKGGKHVYTSSLLSTEQRFSVGDKTEILYNTNHIIEARTNSLFDIWLVPLAFCFCGIFYTIIYCLVRRALFPNGLVCRQSESRKVIQ